MVAQCRRSPCKTDTRLEVPASMEALVEAAAGSALAGEVDIARSKVVIRLLIVGFYPGRVRLVPQAKI